MLQNRPAVDWLTTRGTYWNRLTRNLDRVCNVTNQYKFHVWTYYVCEIAASRCTTKHRCSWADSRQGERAAFDLTSRTTNSPSKGKLKTRRAVHARKLSFVCIWQVVTFNTSSLKLLNITTGAGVSLCGWRGRRAVPRVRHRRRGRGASITLRNSISIPVSVKQSTFPHSTNSTSRVIMKNDNDNDNDKSWSQLSTSANRLS